MARKTTSKAIIKGIEIVDLLSSEKIGEIFSFVLEEEFEFLSTEDLDFLLLDFCSS